jgi:hypothetical protein
MRNLFLLPFLLASPVLAEQRPIQKTTESSSFDLRNPCYALTDRDSFAKCADENKLLPMPTRPVIFGGSGSRFPYLKFIDFSSIGIIYISYPPPIAETKYGIAVDIDCDKKYLYIIQPDGRRNLAGTFEANSTSDFMCKRFD